MSSIAQAALPLRPLLGRLARRVLMLGAVLLCLLALYLLWLRDLSLFAVKTVRVEGIAAKSSDAAELRRALVDAAGEMTTLHVRSDLLRDAAARFPLVDSIRADPGFPNSLTIHVSERRPIALFGSGAIAVADDGTILRGVPTDDLELPSLPLTRVPARDHLVGTARQQAVVLGQAPEALLPYVDRSANGSEGVVVTLDSGIELLFGDASKARQKWRAAAAVLADPALTALDYVDLTAPRRPAVGGDGYPLPAAP